MTQRICPESNALRTLRNTDKHVKGPFFADIHIAVLYAQSALHTQYDSIAALLQCTYMTSQHVTTGL